ncbi:ATP-binding response regulator [Haloplanus halophilus]|uniref:ATP-binding response regulator n=1 Tax=Haloplanus halophilus TaxID=2949993 RepID=UPI00203AE054|nr:hybrid sensor histidine kinase/response regulator [Haloplanus sp. GDY1]
MATGPADGLDVLLVEDNEGDARLIRHHLRTNTSSVFEPPNITHVESLPAALDRLAEGDFDLVLLDLGLSDSRGIETLERLNERIESDDDVSRLPVVVLTGLTDDETALKAIQEGAQDYLLKGDLDGALLERAIRYAMERHRQERRLKRQNERLERFASIVSHDLRNPLNVAQGRLTHEVGLREGTNVSTEHVEEAVDALDRMEVLVDDLLELAREGRSVDAVESVDIADLARSAWDSVEAPASDLRVEVGGTVTADPGRLTQLFENLFRNSVEHGSTNSRSETDDSVEHGSTDTADDGVTITVGHVADGFYVADDGPGIPESERDEVFEAGYSTTAEGTGFGLDIVQEVVDAHDWDVAVTESAAGGARFEITGLGLDGE